MFEQKKPFGMILFCANILCGALKTAPYG